RERHHTLRPAHARRQEARSSREVRDHPQPPDLGLSHPVCDGPDSRRVDHLPSPDHRLMSESSNKVSVRLLIWIGVAISLMTILYLNIDWWIGDRTSIHIDWVGDRPV